MIGKRATLRGPQVDPTLARTVLVSTKFDTRIPQFSAAADVEAFLHPGKAQLAQANMLGGAPFFTSVPSGRVGTGPDTVFRTCVASCQKSLCRRCVPLSAARPS